MCILKIVVLSMLMLSTISCNGIEQPGQTPYMSFSDSTLVGPFKFETPGINLDTGSDGRYLFSKMGNYFDLYFNSKLNEFDSCLDARNLNSNKISAAEVEHAVNIYRLGTDAAHTPRMAISLIFTQSKILLQSCDPALGESSVLLERQEVPILDSLTNFEFASLFSPATNTPVYYMSTWSLGHEPKYYVIECINAQDYSRTAMDFMTDDEYFQIAARRTLIDGIFKMNFSR